jgi:FkbM family methyltransferase
MSSVISKMKRLISSRYPTVLSPLELSQYYGISIESVLHVGAHTGQEAPAYWSFGIRKCVFVEADPGTFQKLAIHVKKFPTYRAVNALVGAKNEKNVRFNIASNDGMSSSFLIPKRHLVQRPDIEFKNSIKLEMRRLDDLKLGSFDLVVVDVQGAERHVIRGGLETVTNAKALYLECNVGDMYEYDINIVELINLLEPWFLPVYLKMKKQLWGDVFLISKRLLK